MSNLTSASGEASVSSGTRGDTKTVQQLTASAAANTSSQQPTIKRKRSLPGTPDPDAEVIALSPKTLMTTNRFVCEICNKGFQRDQNLQLHRRGHNLPWKLKQRNSKEIRKRVYICPEKSCVHHDPARALGDLTGVKKHFCRKHGEKKWKCDKCSKRYAVQSDWKAHSKTCGTREYRCDCGTLFSRRDSFITHRAFCDALAEESARVSAGITVGGIQLPGNNSLSAGLQAAGGSSMSVMRGVAGAGVGAGAGAGLGSSSSFRPGSGVPPLGAHAAQFPFTVRPSRMGGIPESGLSLVSHTNAGPSTRPRLSLWPENTDQMMGAQHNSQHIQQMNPMDVNPSAFFAQSPKTMQAMLGLSEYDDSQAGKGANLSGFLPMSSSNSGTLYSNLLTSGSLNASAGINTDFGVTNWTDRSGSAASRRSLSTSAGLTTSSSSNANNNINVDSLYSSNNNTNSQQQQQQQQTYNIPQMSATALLQKAAQMGATASNSPIFGVFGMAGSDVGLGLSWHESATGGQEGQQRAAGMAEMVSGLDHNSHPFSIGSHGGHSGSQFGGNTRSPEHAGLQDLMNSLSGGPGSGFFTGGVLSNTQFGGNVTDSGNNFGRMINISANASDNNNQRMNPLSNHDIRSFTQKPMGIQGGRCHPNLVLPGIGGLNPRTGADQEGGDGLTRDFLGVGHAAGGRTHLSQRELANISSLGSGIDLVSYTNQRDNSQSVGTADAELSPTKSWDAS